MDGSCLCRLMSIAEETLTEFLSKATGTAVEWVQMPGMKVGWLPLHHFLLFLLPLNLRFCSAFLAMVTCSLVRIPLESLPSRMVARVSLRGLAASWAWSLRK